ncbi:hypothetical protein IRZ59_21980 [Pseudomonas guariconensis]|uniref:hypothetical protein n=1 Tax=Pseudomonas guariconensis TaxID=1288410 RepID=UPI0018AB31D3|nr:hypothetical protein [Pseudomonas guariconensis]MBF8733103.1 hypothetical protein [Pseudomonas guariconensis]
MPSDIEICNIALGRVSNTQPIASFTERSKQAELCQTFYSLLREIVLQDFPWPFAESIVALADVGSPAPGWQFRYRYPADCLLVREIVTPGQNRVLSSSMEIPYKVGYDPGGRVIHTDQPMASVRFTFNVQNPTNFDALFVDALAWRLAMDLALPLSSKPEYRTFCEQQYQNALTIAQGAAFRESQDGEMPESEFVTVRS